MIRTPLGHRRVLRVGVVALWSLCAAIPSTAFAQDEARDRATGSVAFQDRPEAQDVPVYDSKTEATFTGTVSDVQSGGPGRLGWLMRVHTLGLGHKGAQETHVLVKTDAEAVLIHLGPTTFLKQKGVKINEADAVQVVGSRIARDDSEMVLAREIRMGTNAWTLRDPTGQPLWASVETPSRRFWTKNKIILISVVAAKVSLLTTVLRH